MEPDPDIQTIKRTILDAVCDATHKLTPLEIEKKVFQKLPADSSHVKVALKELISEGNLAYTYIYGCSFLEKSYNKPIRISDSIVLKPPNFRYAGGPGEIVISLQHGASFGTGDHPSTRLALRGIEHALSGGAGRALSAEHKKKSRALDIGTGSGILAISAVLLGIGTAVGIDIEPCARVEAKTNVKLNNIEDRITIFEQPIESIDESFFLVIANLRYPTLRRIYPHMRRIANTGSFLVISGVKADESADFLDLYKKDSFELIWCEPEKDWAGFVFEKKKE